MVGLPEPRFPIFLLHTSDVVWREPLPENRIVLRHCGKITPDNISSYLAAGGFQGLKQAKGAMSPGKVVEEIKASGLRGRGGAGFPCGLKWEMAAGGGSEEKFLVCNADEGEVGTFKDRYILENDPFGIIEGILIACYATGATGVFIYLREEYSFLAGKLRSALEQTAGEGFSEGIEIQLVMGAGAYICGEETALLESIEGKRGEPRHRPPYPTRKGLFGEPTIIHNIETLMNLPWIIMNGADSFRKIGTEGNSGTKVFSVSGDVPRPGVYELPLGCRLDELVCDYAGAHDVKLVQVGGGAGRIIPGDRLEITLTYDSVLGSGAVIVMDNSRDVIDIVHLSLEFFAEESCGKCAPCREGTQVLLGILERIREGEGSRGNIETLEQLGSVMRSSSICGLGQSAPVPLLDSLNYYRSVYELRLEQSRYLRGLNGKSNDGCSIGGTIESGS